MVVVVAIIRTDSLPTRPRQVPLEVGMQSGEAVYFAPVSSKFYPELAAYYAAEAGQWLDDCLDANFENGFSRHEPEDYRLRLQRGPWESQWHFVDFTVNDLNAVDAQILSHWLQAN